MNILIANDDGINANGIRQLAKELSKIADVYMIAPASERSANSHHLTLSGRMRIDEIDVEGCVKAYALEGTPADCVHVGLTYNLIDHVDLVVSGINRGWNMYSDLIYSGTVAAAREAFMHNTPAIAFSLANPSNLDYTLASKIALKIVKEYLKLPKRKECFLNVNIPDLPLNEIKGVKVCKHGGYIRYNENYKDIIEDEVRYIELGAPDSYYDFDVNDPDIDINALDNGYITILPLDNDHINYGVADDVIEDWKDYQIHKED